VTYRTPPVRLPRPVTANSAGLSPKRAPAFVAGLLAALAVAGSAAADPTSIPSKQAQAQQVLAQIQAIDVEVARAAEAYNLANVKLARIEREQRHNAELLVHARRNLGRAQRSLQERIVALYTSGETSDSTLSVLIGATSLDDLLNRLDTIDRVSTQDAEVLRQVKDFRGQVERQKRQLARARSAQADVVAARAAYRSQVESRLAARQQLLASIRSEIARLQAEERARQRRLEAQARARLRAQAAVAASAAHDDQAGIGISVETPTASVAPPSRYGGAVGIAMQYLGIPYQWGGASPSGFDCSGFVMYVYAQLGVSLPHNAAAQFGYGTPVSRSELQTGDLVFFNGLGHNGIYIGGDQFIHSPHTGDVVKISSLNDSWYAGTWYGAKRL
jgi:cell wall-associated NlpC family hydrolase